MLGNELLALEDELLLELEDDEVDEFLEPPEERAWEYESAGNAIMASATVDATAR